MAASAAVSAQGTPSGLGVPGGDDFALSDEEEDRKPSIEYLDSLNDYRKRSRSREDIGTPKSKLARLDSGGFEGVKVNGNGHWLVPDVAERTTPDAVDEAADEAPPTDDPLVHGSFYFFLHQINYVVSSDFPLL